MEALSETLWDVIISGTGLQQSLLALALSRSDKKILHVDQNDYYGGPEAAFTLQEAEAWVKKVNEEPNSYPFEAAEIVRTPSSNSSNEKVKLGFSRAYSLSLAPHLLYSRARLLSALVSSKVFRQLEFLAVGSWFVYRPANEQGEDATSADSSLARVPNGREDVFADASIPVKSKRALIRFLRDLMQPPASGDDNKVKTDDEDIALDKPFTEYLLSKYQLTPDLCAPLLSLALVSEAADKVPASLVLPKIKRHLSSMGMFGPGFGAVIPKWGGDSEIAQVGCRACAVGGGVYVLNHGVESIERREDDGARFVVKLRDGDTVRAKAIVGSRWDLPEGSLPPQSQQGSLSCVKEARSISIVSSPLESLFPQTAEGGPVPAVAVVYVPGEHPAYLLVHSSDTGECPVGQCIIYGSTSLSGEPGQTHLQNCVDQFVASVDASASVPWMMKYTALGISEGPSSDATGGGVSVANGMYAFPPPTLGVAASDGVLEQVKSVWQSLLGKEWGQDLKVARFLVFEDREPIDEDEEEQMDA